jgi:hypothetical protein
MLFKTLSAAVNGIDANIIEVEPFCGRERGAAEREPAGEILSAAKDPSSHVV